ncbi:hypothetical protein NBT05_12645 [Aquimarina sp. ERC-38]|uniref:hypothetical protein n=1 Tax=Aquimarina sp. ERC-38 TaxID=2949996 RepID=UPI002246F9B0|nr:hypothetical protein [Aquimarina sp. ERC-38]UZO79797.1 hypothetical protein NBT05_12645 [Aquimarina sp. ERC-38]
MKNWIKNVGVLVLLFASMAMKADDGLSIEINNISFVNVSLTNVEKGDKLILTDQSDVVLYNITLEASNQFRKYFNLHNVPNGTYYVEIENQKYIKKTPIIKTDNGVSLQEGSEVTVFKPQIEVADKVLKVLFVNTELKPFTLSVYDKSGILLSTSKINEKEVLTKTFDFTTMPKGVYSVNVDVDDKSFSKSFSI